MLTLLKEKYDRYRTRPQNRPANYVYVPHQWDVDIKSDIFTLGLIAMNLMTCVNQKDRANYNQQLGNMCNQAWGGTTVTATDIPWNRDNWFHDDYRLCLVKLVKEMLSYNPADRPDLDQLDERIHRELEKLDRQYGDAVTAPKDKIIDDFRIPIPESEHPFTWNARFIPQERRRIGAPTGDVVAAQEYRTLLDQWRTGDFNGPLSDQLVTSVRFLLPHSPFRQ